MAIILKIVITIIIAITIDYFPLVWYFCNDFDERSLKMIGMKKLIFLSGCLIASCAALFAADEQQLFDAVKSKNLSRVNMYSYANANQLFKQGGKAMTAFQLAVENGDLNIATALLVDGNADVNADYGVEPPLFIAVRKNNLKMVQLLLQYGAEPNLQYGDKLPIFIAADNQNEKIFAELIKKGADVNSGYNDKPLIAYLLSNGKNTNRNTLIEVLCSTADQTGQRINWGWNDRDGRNILHYAVSGGDFNNFQGGSAGSVDYIIRKAGQGNSGAMQRQKDNETGSTPLHFAVEGGNPDIVRALARTSESSQVMKSTDAHGFNPLGRYIFTNAQSTHVNYDLIKCLVEVPGVTISSFAMPRNYKNGENGLFILLGKKGGATTQDIVDFINILGQQDKTIAGVSDPNGDSLLCVGVNERWDPAIIDALLEYYDGDFLALTAKVKGERRDAVEIMRLNHSERQYQSIFDRYMN